jgi:UDP-N-acetyl-D-galactosamine dehydrogenase
MTINSTGNLHVHDQDAFYRNESGLLAFSTELQEIIESRKEPPRRPLPRSRGSEETGIAVVGLGYVGLPVALALSREHATTPVFGFDISKTRLEELDRGFDRTGETASDCLLRSDITLVGDPKRLKDCSFFIVAVPTPIDDDNRPDLQPLIGACRAIGPCLRPGAVVVFESTVYPGLTRQICGQILAESSGLRQSVDFKLGYSPERIVPGDTQRRLETVVKIVSGEDEETLDRIASVYAKVASAGLHRASSIEVAEAAKLIENIQRDVNIALMNEFAVILDRLGVSTRDVLAAAATKWNFQPFQPGLVGGHCIGVDPYYLTTKAEEVGYFAEIVTSARRVNNAMGSFIAQRLIAMLVARGRNVQAARIGILGLAFKENVSDIRNSRVPDIVRELTAAGADVSVCDPLADVEEAASAYGINLVQPGCLHGLDGLVLAVPHARLTKSTNDLFAMLRRDGVFIDVKSAIKLGAVPDGVAYWSL